MRGFLIVLALLILALAGAWWQGVIGRPTLETINDLRFTSMQSNNITVVGDAVFYNPNPFPCEVIATDLIVSINDVRVGRVKQTHETKIEASSNFIVPVEVRFSPKKLLGEKGLLGGIMTLFNEQTMDVHYQGTITVRFFGIREVTVEVSDQETLNVNLK